MSLKQDQEQTRILGGLLFLGVVMGAVLGAVTAILMCR